MVLVQLHQYLELWQEYRRVRSSYVRPAGVSFPRNVQCEYIMREHFDILVRCHEINSFLVCEMSDRDYTLFSLKWQKSVKK